MGELKVSHPGEGDAQRAFTRRVLDDLEALERMLDNDMFESGVRRVGAEQEMFLVDAAHRPAPVADEVLARLTGEPGFTTELALFNLEYNAEPRIYGGKCLSDLEAELEEKLAIARAAAQACAADVMLTGILPTLRQDDLSLENMTPRPRYRALNDMMSQMRGGDFRVALKGIDELELTHDNVMLEACNTSFQVHFQVAPSEFAKLYNIAQAVTAPVLAAAVNSPVLLAHRLWSETRVGLFQQSVDERSHAKTQRGTRPRVSFGDRWVDNSVLEIFREDVSRFRILVSNDLEGDPESLALVEQGVAPKLRALRLHNGTVYRWNRACYGIDDANVPHLRVENRVLPSGPTIADEVANAAFFFGLMSGFIEEHGEIQHKMRFDDARTNFFSAARYGLKAQFHWLDGRRYPASELILNELLPLAREGLRVSNLDDDDAERYLDIVRQRTEREQTGAQWLVQSLQEMPPSEKREAGLFAVAAAIKRHQWSGAPVHTWPLAQAHEQPPRGHVYRTVGQLMTREVFTVQEGDLVDLAASMMDWERVRHIPVEDDHGRLVGLLSHRDLLRLVARGKHGKPVAVGDIMRRDPRTVTPETTSLEALRLMHVENLGCLPVVKGERLVGILTERDFLDVTRTLLEKALEEAQDLSTTEGAPVESSD